MTKQKNSLKMYGDEPELIDKIVDHSGFQWVTKNSSNIFYGVLTIIALLFVLYRMGASDQVKAENDYFTAAKDYQTFASSGDDAANAGDQQDALRNLEGILARRPELNSKYDALIVQELLIQGDAQKAQPLAMQTFKRTEKNNLPLYQDFAKITLLISSGDYKAALEKSKVLKQNIDSSKPETVGHTLIAYNLLRIPLLEEMLGNDQEAINAWKEIKSYLYAENENPKLLDTRTIFDNLFAEGSVSLKNFIDYNVQKTEKKSAK